MVRILARAGVGDMVRTMAIVIACVKVTVIFHVKVVFRVRIMVRVWFV
jgi:hypothetical protein